MGKCVTKKQPHNFLSTCYTRIGRLFVGKPIFFGLHKVCYVISSHEEVKKVQLDCIPLWTDFLACRVFILRKNWHISRDVVAEWGSVKFMHLGAGDKSKKNLVLN